MDGGPSFAEFEVKKRGKSASINWRWDSTTMLLRMKKQQAQVRYNWCLAKLESLKDVLEADDRKRLADVLCSGAGSCRLEWRCR